MPEDRLWSFLVLVCLFSVAHSVGAITLVLTAVQLCAAVYTLAQGQTNVLTHWFSHALGCLMKSPSAAIWLSAFLVSSLCAPVTVAPVAVSALWWPPLALMLLD